jgi:ketosteroid isomerase-like protein
VDDNANPDTNRQVLQALYDALGAGDFGAVLGYLSDDVIGHVPGTSPVAGDYVGKEAVAGYVGSLAERSGGTVRFEPRTVLVAGDRGVGLLRDLAERDGKTLAMDNVHVWRMGDGTLDEIWIYPGDQYAWDEFWS